VPVKPEEKYPILAHRLGKPEFTPTAWEKLLRLERDSFHPMFVN